MIFPTSFPKQHQDCQPGLEYEMSPSPIYDNPLYNKTNDKLKNKVAFITGGDSGIGRSIAVHFAKEGCDIAIIYLEEDEDALTTKKLVEKEGRKCLILKGDLKEEEFCIESLQKCIKEFKKIKQKLFSNY